MERPPTTARDVPIRVHVLFREGYPPWIGSTKVKADLELPTTVPFRGIK